MESKSKRPDEKCMDRYAQGLIRKAGKEKLPGVYAVCCSACGKELLTMDQNICFTVTRRKTVVFWCADCEQSVWDSKIK